MWRFGDMRTVKYPHHAASAESPPGSEKIIQIKD
jgi:hypothetical protein